MTEKDDAAQRAAELRKRSQELDKASEGMSWHPTKGKQLSDESDAAWNEARDEDPTGK